MALGSKTSDVKKDREGENGSGCLPGGKKKKTVTMGLIDSSSLRNPFAPWREKPKRGEDAKQQMPPG